MYTVFKVFVQFLLYIKLLWHYFINSNINSIWYLQDEQRRSTSTWKVHRKLSEKIKYLPILLLFPTNFYQYKHHQQLPYLTLETRVILFSSKIFSFVRAIFNFKSRRVIEWRIEALTLVKHRVTKNVCYIIEENRLISKKKLSLDFVLFNLFSYLTYTGSALVGEIGAVEFISGRYKESRVTVSISFVSPEINRREVSSICETPSSPFSSSSIFIFLSYRHLERTSCRMIDEWNIIGTFSFREKQYFSYRFDEVFLAPICSAFFNSLEDFERKSDRLKKRKRGWARFLDVVLLERSARDVKASIR